MYINYCKSLTCNAGMSVWLDVVEILQLRGFASLHLLMHAYLGTNKFCILTCRMFDQFWSLSLSLSLKNAFDSCMNEPIRITTRILWKCCSHPPSPWGRKCTLATFPARCSDVERSMCTRKFISRENPFGFAARKLGRTWPWQQIRGAA